MPVTPAGSTLGIRHNPAGRLEFHVRLPDVPPENATPSGPVLASSEPTRGLEILNGILDRRTHSPWRQIARYCWMNRFWLFCVLLVGLCGLALALGFTREQEIAGPAEQEAFPDQELVDLEGDLPSHTMPVVPESTGVVNAARTQEAAENTDVRAAVYQTTRKLPPRAVWLEGGILPDDAPTP